MCLASDEENELIITYDQAYNFQKGFGIYLDKYEGFSKEDLVQLKRTQSRSGLIQYIQEGGKLLPMEFIKDCQDTMYDFCHLEDTEVNGKTKQILVMI